MPHWKGGDRNVVLLTLGREVELFRTIYNARIEYYRQLQLLSVSSHPDLCSRLTI